MFTNSMEFEILLSVTAVSFILLNTCIEGGVWLVLMGLKERSDELPADLVVLAAFKRGIWVDRCTAV